MYKNKNLDILSNDIKSDKICIQSLGAGKRILAQMHPISLYDSENDRFNAMYTSIKKFEFRNEVNRGELISYISIKLD